MGGGHPDSDGGNTDPVGVFADLGLLEEVDRIRIRVSINNPDPTL